MADSTQVNTTPTTDTNPNGTVTSPTTPSTDLSASFLGDNDVESFYKSVIGQEETAETTTEASLQQQHQLDINKLTSDTNYSSDLMTEAYNKAMGMLNLAPATVSSKVNTLTTDYTRDIAKLNADETYAQQTGNINYANSIAADRNNLLNSINSSISSLLSFEQTQQNYARDRVTTMATTGAIEHMDDTQLSNLAAQSGYSLEDLQGMRTAVAAKDDATLNKLVAESQLEAAKANQAASEMNLQPTSYREWEAAGGDSWMSYGSYLNQLKFSQTDAKAVIARAVPPKRISGGFLGLGAVWEYTDPGTGAKYTASSLDDAQSQQNELLQAALTNYSISSPTSTAPSTGSTWQ